MFLASSAEVIYSVFNGRGYSLFFYVCKKVRRDEASS